MTKKIECVRYDRVVGYFAPWNLTANNGKKEEIRERARMSKAAIAYALQDTLPTKNVEAIA
jgi:hypothetical protein